MCDQLVVTTHDGPDPRTNKLKADANWQRCPDCGKRWKKCDCPPELHPLVKATIEHFGPDGPSPEVASEELAYMEGELKRLVDMGYERTTGLMKQYAEAIRRYTNLGG